MTTTMTREPKQLLTTEWLALADAFWALVAIAGPDDCWNWTGYVNNRQYGKFSRRGRQAFAHRVAYVLAHGDIPAGLSVDHLCFNTLCCNGRHLELVTKAENTQRMLAKKTTCSRGHEYDGLQWNSTAGQWVRRCSVCIQLGANRNRDRKNARRRERRRLKNSARDEPLLTERPATRTKELS